jgi:hypothetical protein
MQLIRFAIATIDNVCTRPIADHSAMVSGPTSQRVFSVSTVVRVSPARIASSVGFLALAGLCSSFFRSPVGSHYHWLDLPQYSAVKFALIALVALMAFAGIVFFVLMRRHRWSYVEVNNDQLYVRSIFGGFNVSLLSILAFQAGPYPLADNKRRYISTLLSDQSFDSILASLRELSAHS